MFPTVIIIGNVFLTVITSGNMFPTIISGRIVFPTVITSRKVFPTVTTSENVFLTVITNQNVFPTVITSQNVFPTVITCGNMLSTNINSGNVWNALCMHLNKQHVLRQQGGPARKGARCFLGRKKVKWLYLKKCGRRSKYHISVLIMISIEIEKQFFPPMITLYQCFKNFTSQLATTISLFALNIEQQLEIFVLLWLFIFKNDKLRSNKKCYFFTK